MWFAAPCNSTLRYELMVVSALLEIDLRSASSELLLETVWSVSDLTS